jgi:hypothetical protein
MITITTKEEVKMDILSKRPHEVSIWDDVLVAVDLNGNEHEGIVDTSQYEIVG